MIRGEVDTVIRPRIWQPETWNLWFYLQGEKSKARQRGSWCFSGPPLFVAPRLLSRHVDHFHPLPRVLHLVWYYLQSNKYENKDETNMKTNTKKNTKTFSHSSHKQHIISDGIFLMFGQICARQTKSIIVRDPFLELEQTLALKTWICQTICIPNWPADDDGGLVNGGGDWVLLTKLLNWVLRVAT